MFALEASVAVAAEEEDAVVTSSDVTFLGSCAVSICIILSRRSCLCIHHRYAYMYISHTR